MAMDNNLTELLDATAEIAVTGKANFYSLQFSFRNRQDNFSICLPDNMNKELLEEICEYLKGFSELTCALFNPVGQDDNVYEFLPYENISSSWKKISELYCNSDDYKQEENKEKISLSNLSICELKYGDSNYYLCAKQLSSAKLFKGKKVLMSTNDKIEAHSPKKVFLFGCNVDFVIRINDVDSSIQVFILNRKNFISIFNYYEYLQNEVKKHTDEIQKWPFLSSSELIIKKIEQQNVYRNLAKVFSDAEYVAQMKAISPSVLKNRLIEKSGGKFTELDFEGDQISVTTQNLDKVMKMLAKGFKYNFFTDRAEEQ